MKALWSLSSICSRLSHAGDPQPLGLENPGAQRAGLFLLPHQSTERPTLGASSWVGEGSLCLSLTVVLRAILCMFLHPKPCWLECFRGHEGSRLSILHPPVSTGSFWRDGLGVGVEVA